MKPLPPADRLKDIITHYSELPPIMSDSEFITPDELWEVGMGICSNCGKMVFQKQHHCYDCGEYLVILRESTINEIDKHKKSKNHE